MAGSGELLILARLLQGVGYELAHAKVDLHALGVLGLADPVGVVPERGDAHAVLRPFDRRADTLEQHLPTIADADGLLTRHRLAHRWTAKGDARGVGVGDVERGGRATPRL